MGNLAIIKIICAIFVILNVKFVQEFKRKIALNAKVDILNTLLKPYNVYKYVLFLLLLIYNQEHAKAAILNVLHALEN